MVSTHNWSLIFYWFLLEWDTEQSRCRWSIVIVVLGAQIVVSGRMNEVHACLQIARRFCSLSDSTACHSRFAFHSRREREYVCVCAIIRSQGKASLHERQKNGMSSEWPTQQRSEHAGCMFQRSFSSLLCPTDSASHQLKENTYTIVTANPFQPYSAGTGIILILSRVIVTFLPEMNRAEFHRHTSSHRFRKEES